MNAAVPKKRKKAEKKPSQVEETAVAKEEIKEELSTEIAPKQEVIEYDENKTTMQKLQEHKFFNYNPDKHIFGFEPHGTAVYKVMVGEIKSLTALTYVADGLDNPLVVINKRFLVSHCGRRACDHVTEEVFNKLLQDYPGFLKKVTYYVVDISDPTEGRFSYTGDKPDFFTTALVESSRKKRQKVVDRNLKKDSDESYTEVNEDELHQQDNGIEDAPEVGSEPEES